MPLQRRRVAPSQPTPLDWANTGCMVTKALITTATASSDCRHVPLISFSSLKDVRVCVALTYVSLGDPATITGSTRPVPGQLKRLGELLYIRRKWNMVGNADICVRGSELRSAQL